MVKITYVPLRNNYRPNRALERQSLSEVKMGRGSPICERAHKKIVEYFKNNVPQRQIAKALQISSSTVRNIIKSFRENGEISVRKGQGQRPLLDACGLQALRQHCITHRHDSVIDITKWAQEYFQKPLSVNTIHKKSQHHWWYGGAYGMGSLHVLEGTMNAERYLKVLEQHMLPSRWRLFQQDNAKSHTAAITTAWLHSIRVRVLNWPACSPDLSPIENIWCIIKRKTPQRQPLTTLQQLETYIRQEWDQIPTPKLQKLITSMPRRLQTVLKRRGDATPW